MPLVVADAQSKLGAVVNPMPGDAALSIFLVRKRSAI
jgi:hypothetical protein